jgi:hypothetical protein
MAGAIKRPENLPAPTGTAPHDDDPYPCDGCDRRIMPGRPYWGGGLDYFGEAREVHCERCAISWHIAAEQECDEYERQLGEKR